ncbi:caib/baif family protein [Mycobacterium xenopi RIVM700367]|uniref:CaiB/BaiF CoA transferase family protein n=1 Tax=Mycobacterium xenopi TaxID=1789 RepID=UPI00025AE7FB|nr:CoA transferase [Mycobacterium xenopi]EID11479.1 caib/baif family protein [Mycobacterium xenopi RIVM700367]
MTGPLDGLRVIEIADEITGPYCTKLFVDLGAEVTKLESPSGDPLRRWGPFPGGVADPEHCGLFEYLNAGKHGLTVDFAREHDRMLVRNLIEHADLLVESLPPGTLGNVGFDADALQQLNPRLVVVRISNFGQQGPFRDRPATPLTLQAAAGWITGRDPERPPVQAGARISEYIAGAYAALGALTALRIRLDDSPIEVDVSVLESLLSTLPYPMLMAERMRTLGLPANTRSAPMLGIVRAADGWVGINCLTGQHWLDVCAMLGLPEFGEHQIAVMMGGPERAEFFAKAQPWLAKRSVQEIVELSQALRIPAAPVVDGATALQCPQYRKRGYFIEAGADGWSFVRPGPPFRFSRTPVPAPRPAPRPGEQSMRAKSADRPPAAAVAPVDLPFADVKVLDLSTFWAGAYLTCYLGAFGADVVKVESIQRPDGHRYSGAYPHEGDDWYERSAIWQATNLNKRDLTLDLTSEWGRELARRLASAVDVVVENFSPRVVEQFGLDYESLVPLRPDVIQVRMPGFGLEGPWRDYVGWALNIEQVSGMAAVTGYPDGPPCNLQGPADPVVGLHAGIALLAALEHRRRTGEGQLIEIAQIEVAACVTAEPVIEYSMNGVVRPREGNRRRGYLQGVYPTSVDGAWVAVSVRDDTDWRHLLAVIGGVAPHDEASAVGHDVFDEIVADWTRSRTPDQIVATLHEHGIPAEELLTPEQMYDVPPLDARGYYQELEHPITGVHRYPGWPFRIVPGPGRHHRCAPPTLGQHNDEILRQLGLSRDQIATLRVQRVIGNRPLNA